MTTLPPGPAEPPVLQTLRWLLRPTFHGERMRAYESIVAEAVARDVESWPTGSQFALHPHMQAVTLEVIVRAVFGVTDPGRRKELTGRLGRLLETSASAGL